MYFVVGFQTLHTKWLKALFVRTKEGDHVVFVEMAAIISSRILTTLRKHCLKFIQNIKDKRLLQIKMEKKVWEYIKAQIFILTLLKLYSNNHQWVLQRQRKQSNQRKNYSPRKKNSLKEHLACKESSKLAKK